MSEGIICDRLDGAEFYRIRNGGEWAHITINERTGTFMAQSSYGTFGYIWTAIGDCTLKQFLAGLEYGYFFSKVAASHGYKFSADRTIQSLREMIIEARREKDIDDLEARTLWRVADTAKEYDDEGAFLGAMYFDYDMSRFLRGDVTGVTRRERDPQCAGFWEKIWPVFLAEIAPKVGKEAA